MITAKVEDLLNRRLDQAETEEYPLYIVRTDEVVFYIGQGRDVIERLWGHLGQGGFRGALSNLGLFIMGNLPESRNFDIVLMRPDEVNPKYVGKILDITQDKNWELIKHLFPAPKAEVIFYKFQIDKAEQELIKTLQPCLNITHNYNPAWLPKKYKDPRQLEPGELY
jgi:hypothetical protein